VGNDCVFCKIIAHDEVGSFVYEDDRVVAFMDINQPNRYKVLVMPRRHATFLYDLTDNEAAAILPVAKRIALAIRALTDCDGLSVFQLNGAAAGQDVFHYHLHLLPRYTDDGHRLRQRKVESRQLLDKLAADLRAVLNNN
jgi:histidine triad (HIT) family protein